ncbi:hypothetical protein [Rhodopila sp.]|uniref:hypothetical protein n=1 Tax=Rhodopila sp. TaxID=2480087 RepID=UPI003D0BBD52
MSDNPMDRLPAFNRVSIRAVLVKDGEDPSHALAEAGFAEAVAIPVVIGDDLDLSGDILGNGITPNLTAVLETEIADAGPDAAPATQSGQARAKAKTPPGPGSTTTNLPAAFGMQPLAPVRKRGA